MFEIRFDTGNSAFDQAPDEEISRVLDEVAKEIAARPAVHFNRREDGIIRDSNGNRIGGWSYRPARI
ncbi:hypothetical protein [Inquilinus limosus]|uniref:Uncharacterized protein n=1 Tax=Inquilinus limosus MP06 TaxID=1398085 RepID=A0A0A0DBU5_9PROT|nr:hypothetical protein [Inquilinus limosus]KGM36186.1 hypothetical protein P409_00630 [Inquilinus limosus MP06]